MKFVITLRNRHQQLEDWTDNKVVEEEVEPDCQVLGEMYTALELVEAMRTSG